MDNISKIIEEIVKDLDEQEAKEKWFEERTNRHIKLVKEAARVLVDKYPEFKDLLDEVEEHDASKFQEPEREAYIELTYRHKLEKEQNEYDPLNGKGYKTPGELDKKEENEATLHHITTNKHHPEYWNKEEANINSEDRDKSNKVLDASKMPDLAIAEMISDWVGMSWELKTNSARDWYNKTKDVRWHWSKHQEELIDKLLLVFEEEEMYKFMNKRIRLTNDVKYVSFIMPKGSEGKCIDYDGGLLTIKFDSNGKALVVPLSSVVALREPMHSMDMHDEEGEDDGW
jgi:hypothetical protein